jgi:GNAT superfamily N-acetyltransferase
MVGTLVGRLLAELYPDLAHIYQPERLIPVAEQLLGRAETVFAFVATDSDDRTVGVLTLNRCEAIYAFGHFGEISEVYVDPDYRSYGIGAELLAAAIAFARSKQWSMLEVGAPDVPRWQKTVDFYARNGFVEVGPRLFLSLD